MDGVLKYQPASNTWTKIDAPRVQPRLFFLTQCTSSAYHAEKLLVCGGQSHYQRTKVAGYFDMRHPVFFGLSSLPDPRRRTSSARQVSAWLWTCPNEIIAGAGSSAITVYYDVANSRKAGHDVYREIRPLGSHIGEVHAKDYDGPFGKGSVDFKEVRRALDGINYRGWIVFESSLRQPTATNPPELEAGFLYDIAYLRSPFPQAQQSRSRV